MFLKTKIKTLDGPILNGTPLVDENIDQNPLVEFGIIRFSFLDLLPIHRICPPPPLKMHNSDENISDTPPSTPPAGSQADVSQMAFLKISKTKLEGLVH